MHIEITTITPLQANALLEGNTANRNIKKAHVAAMARDMARGDWQLNGDAIRINGTGTLIDGQHRLMACVESGVAFKTVIIRGLDHDVQNTIDGGVKRSITDQFQMAGITFAGYTAATVRRVAGIAVGDHRGAKLTNSEINRILDLHRGIHASVEAGTDVFPGMGTLLSSIHYIGTFTGHGGRANECLEVWRTGIPNYSGDAMHALRDRYARARASNTAKITPGDLTKKMVTAWNMFLIGKQVKFVRGDADARIPGWNVGALGISI